MRRITSVGISLATLFVVCASALAQPALADEPSSSEEAKDTQDDPANDDEEAPRDGPANPERSAPSPSPEQGLGVPNGMTDLHPSGNRTAPQQGAQPSLPASFSVQAYRESYTAELRIQSGMLFGLGTSLFVMNIPGTFFLGLLVTASIGAVDDEVGLFLMPFITSNFSAHVTFAAITAIVRGIMEVRISSQLRRPQADHRLRRRELLAGWYFGALPPSNHPRRWARSAL
ncbi:MAG: hypothetical protein CL928_10065 [Deltaproteobacteria bacterium]|nr:hypothetical protein [Deltaproteobacteria bacterium]